MAFQTVTEEPIKPLPQPEMIREIPGDLLPEKPRAVSTAGDAAVKAAATAKRPVGRPPGSGKKPPPPSKKPEVPDFSEWQDFIGTLLIRWLCRAYLAVALAGVRDMLTEEENEDLEFDDDELLTIAKPFAHLVERTKFNKKYGRTVMESRDAIEASVMLFMWSGRVARIRTKYKGKHRKAESHVEFAPGAEDVAIGKDVESGAPVLQGNFGNGIRPAGVGFN